MFLVLNCNLQLAIKNIIDISPELSFIKTGDSLFDHINEGSKNKLRLFLDTLQEQRLANDWEIFVQKDDVEFFLIFDGFQKESGIILFAAENQESKDKLRKKWKSKIGLEKSSVVSNAALSKENETRSDIAIFDDISDMYNEMAALQRELAKKQAQLEKSNSIIQRYANELEELIAERTEELRTSEEKFRGIFENSSLGIAIVDAQGIPLSCNNAFDEIVGVSSKSPVSTNMILDLIGYKDQEWEIAFTDIVERNAFSNPKEIERNLSENRTIWLSVNTYRINQRNDANPLLVILLEDITRRKMDEQALVHAEKLTAVGRIAASLAHEINNPLQAIIGHLSLARELIYQPEEVTNYLQIASEELTRIARIVGDLRQASQKPALKEKKPTDLVHIVNKVLQLVEKKAVNNNIDLELNKERSTMPGLVNAEQIQQVILNLVINSMDAIKQGGKIVISIVHNHRANILQISIEDNGPGVEPEDKNKLFEPFYTTKQEGLGLGLYTSREIIEQHKGKLLLKDSDLGGARFEILIPSEGIE